MKTFNLKQFAQYLRLSQQTIYRMVKKGGIGTRINSQWVFTEEDLRKVLKYD